MNEYLWNCPRLPLHASPTKVMRGNKVIYQSDDAAKWLKNNKYRNVQATARLTF